MYTFSPMMVANSRKHHCRVRSYTREVLVISTNLDIQKNHYPLDFRNRRGDEARIKNTCKYGLDDNTVDFIGHALALHRDDRYLMKTLRTSLAPDVSRPKMLSLLVENLEIMEKLVVEWVRTTYENAYKQAVVAKASVNFRDYM
ncbi:retrotransposon-related protein [Tanacetum coccineum]|uniref:Retrotransposon-related protein n=1 Tax=Tanacetum coccineum TaxID=301880 RepID=A0ABQ5GBJ6_9ASTR